MKNVSSIKKTSWFGKRTLFSFRAMVQRLKTQVEYGSKWTNFLLPTFTSMASLLLLVSRLRMLYFVSLRALAPFAEKERASIISLQHQTRNQIVQHVSGSLNVVKLSNMKGRLMNNTSGVMILLLILRMMLLIPRTLLLCCQHDHCYQHSFRMCEANL